mgnify:CR=1 FL=1
MCAIFGYSGFQDENLITKMSQDQIFRGPDYFNYFTDKKENKAKNQSLNFHCTLRRMYLMMQRKYGKTQI